MPKTPVRKGSAELQLDPGYPEYSNTASGTKVVLVYSATYDTLVARMPLRLQAMPGYSASAIFVDEVLLRKGPGDVSKMTITLVPRPQGNIDSDGTPPQQEIEWVEVQKKLETNPRYQIDGTKALDVLDLDIIEEWRNGSTASERAATYAKIVASYPEAQDLVDKLYHGEDSYIVYQPVGRITERLSDLPTSTPCGVIESPPIEVAVEGYEYLKTADRIVRQRGHFERIREWSGADSWDHDVYPMS